MSARSPGSAVPSTKDETMIHMTGSGRAGRFILTAAVTAAAFALAACGGGSPVAGVGTSAAGQHPLPAPGRAGSGVAPAAYGVIAAVDPADIQVQNPTTGQVTVRFTGTTRFSDAESTSLAAVTVDSCVVATAPTTAAGGAAATPTPRPTAITASIVVITATGGSCAGRPAGVARTRAPRTVPKAGRSPGAVPRRADTISGTVQAVAGSTITVRELARGSAPAVTATVTVTAATSYTHTVTATKAALRVGLCATAMGSTDSTGAVTATRIALSPAGPSGCSPRRGRLGGAGLGRGNG